MPVVRTIHTSGSGITSFLAKYLNVHYRKVNLLTTRFLCVVRGLCEHVRVLGCACVGEGK